ncbi:MAG: ribbon-helix-helix protein, CopG family [Alphaproteobacteria bacterium]|nr:ribbon-helix-helix protein, CopG family [Alphaproteobacteria bacterium]
MSRSTATLSISLPPEMAKELTRIQKTEHRTRSELVREALRVYIRQADQRSLAERIAALPIDEPTDDERDAIRKGRAELAKGQSTPLSSLRHELRRTSRK